MYLPLVSPLFLPHPVDLSLWVTSSTLEALLSHAVIYPQKQSIELLICQKCKARCNKVLRSLPPTATCLCSYASIFLQMEAITKFWLSSLWIKWMFKFTHLSRSCWSCLLTHQASVLLPKWWAVMTALSRFCVWVSSPDKNHKTDEACVIHW